MKESIKNILKTSASYILTALVLAGVIVGICAIVNYEGDRIEADRQDRAAFAAHRAAEDSAQRSAELRLYKEWRAKAESLSVDFYTKWMKVKDAKIFTGCSYREGEYDHDADYMNGQFAGVILCNPHRLVPDRIGNYKLTVVRPQTGELVMFMYSQNFKTIESAVYSGNGKVSEDEAKKVIDAFAKGMGLIQ